jgi:hypothetical protein
VVKHPTMLDLAKHFITLPHIQASRPRFGWLIG